MNIPIAWPQVIGTASSFNATVALDAYMDGSYGRGYGREVFTVAQQQAQRDADTDRRDAWRRKVGLTCP